MRLKKLLLAAIPLALAAHSCFAAEPVSLCAEPGEGSPYFRPLRDQQGKITGYAGFSVDFFKSVFASLGRETRFIGDQSWSRCTAAVERGEIDFAFGAYYTDERAKRFSYSVPFRTLTPQVFFLAARPLQIRTIADLRKYRGCGMFGSSYLHYGLDEKAIDRGANNHESLVMKLKAGRCDYFPEELEVMVNLSNKNGQRYVADPELRHVLVEDAKAPQRHLITAKGGGQQELLPKLDAAINALIRSGEAERIFQRSINNVHK